MIYFYIVNAIVLLLIHAGNMQNLYEKIDIVNSEFHVIGFILATNTKLEFSIDESYEKRSILDKIRGEFYSKRSYYLDRIIVDQNWFNTFLMLHLKSDSGHLKIRLKDGTTTNFNYENFSNFINFYSSIIKNNKELEEEQKRIDEHKEKEKNSKKDRLEKYNDAYNAKWNFLQEKMKSHNSLSKFSIHLMDANDAIDIECKNIYSLEIKKYHDGYHVEIVIFNEKYKYYSIDNIVGVFASADDVFVYLQKLETMTINKKLYSVKEFEVDFVNFILTSKHIIINMQRQLSTEDLLNAF